VKNGTTLTFTGGGSINISNVGISGALASSALVVDGTTVTENVLNTYVGATTISNGGTLNANIAGALPAGTRSAVSFTGTGTSTLSLGANQVAASLTSAGAATVTLGTNTLTVGTASGSTTFAGSIGGAGNLIKDGAGTQVLSGTNGYTGTTTVSGGTLLLDYGTNASVLSSSSALTLGGGTLQVKGRSGAFTTEQTLASLSLTAGTGSTISLNPNGGTSTTLTITGPAITTGAGASVNFNYTAGTTNGSTVGNNIVAWNPTLTSGIIGGTYTVTDIGGTGFATVSAGKVVRLADPGSAGLPLSTGSGANNYFVNSTYSTSNTAVAGSLVEALSGNVAAATVTVDTTGVTSGANLALGANKLTLTTTGGMFFSGANPYAISGTNGITSSGTGTIILYNLITSPSGLTISAPITDTAGTAVTFVGTGTTRLSSTASNYTGLTTVNGGILEVTANNALGTNAAGTSVTAGATLRLTNVNYSTTEALTINGTGVGGTAGALANSGTSTFAGPITVLTSATINAGGGTLNLRGGLVKNGTTLTLTGGGTFNISIVGISGTSASSALVVDGTTVTETVANTYVGATTISNGGVLNANTAGALPTGTRSAVSFTGTGTSTLSLGAGQVVASLTSAGAATVTLNTRTLTVGAASGTTTFAGSIGGAGNLIKDGASTQVLSGTNDYTGTTTVNGGTLLLDSETSTSVLRSATPPRPWPASA